MSFDTLDPVPSAWIHFLAATEVIFGLLSTRPASESLFLSIRLAFERLAW